MTTSRESAPETKSAELSEAFGDFINAFESFKEANDQRLAEIEGRIGADVVTTEKVDRIPRIGRSEAFTRRTVAQAVAAGAGPWRWPRFAIGAQIGLRGLCAVRRRPAAALAWSWPR